MEQMIATGTKQSFEDTKKQVKELIKRLNGKECPDVESVRQEFKDVISKANPLIIAMAENELVKEGLSLEDLLSACDIHLMLFKDAIENPNLKVPDWHPIHQFQEDHRAILKLMEDLQTAIKSAKKKNNYEDSIEEFDFIVKIAGKLMDAENHNIRQENTLFPMLEKHGVEQPPAIMWSEHSEMKEQKKELINFLEKRSSMPFHDLIRVLENTAVRLLEKFSVHTQKEEHILYVTALGVISEEEWKDIKEECDNLGYFDAKI